LNQIEIDNVLKLLPHRYPFLLIDRVLDYSKDESITAIKNVTINEPFFQGHFPRHPVMPGVLILEAIAQACAILSFKSIETLLDKGSIYYLVGIDKARFKRPVEPGDRLIIKAKIIRKVKRIWLFEGSAYVDDNLCCSTELMCTYKDIE